MPQSFIYYISVEFVGNGNTFYLPGEVFFMNFFIAWPNQATTATLCIQLIQLAFLLLY